MEITTSEVTNPPRRRTNKTSLEELRGFITEDRLRGLIDSGSCKTKEIADENNARPQDIRTLIIEYFGDTVEFRRGRNGGVYWTNGGNDGNS